MIGGFFLGFVGLWVGDDILRLVMFGRGDVGFLKIGIFGGLFIGGVVCDCFSLIGLVLGEGVVFGVVVCVMDGDIIFDLFVWFVCLGFVFGVIFLGVVFFFVIGVGVFVFIVLGLGVFMFVLWFLIE